MTPFSERRPVAFALILWLIFFIFEVAAGTIATIGELGNMGQLFMANGLVILLILLVVSRKRWWREIGMAPVQKQDWLLFLIPLVLPATNLARGWHVTDLGQIGLLLLAGALVGFMEEGFFRGLLLRVLQPKGLAWAAWGTAVLFGLPHLLNVMGGQSLAVSLIQVFYALVFGLVFALVALAARAIWPLMLIHGLNNIFVWGAEGGIGQGKEPTNAELLLVVALVAVFAVYAVFLWRRLRTPEAAKQAA